MAEEKINALDKTDKILLVFILAMLVIVAIVSIYQAFKTPECHKNIYNCKDFHDHIKAQFIFEECGGKINDVHNLDGDNDGLACEGVDG